jgi:hypothetical protein
MNTENVIYSWDKQELIVVIRYLYVLIGSNPMTIELHDDTYITK